MKDLLTIFNEEEWWADYHTYWFAKENDLTFEEVIKEIIMSFEGEGNIPIYKTPAYLLKAVYKTTYLTPSSILNYDYAELRSILHNKGYDEAKVMEVINEIRAESVKKYKEENKKPQVT